MKYERKYLDCVKIHDCTSCDTEWIASVKSDRGLQILFREPPHHILPFPSAAEPQKWLLKSGPGLRQRGDICIFYLRSCALFKFSQFNFKRVAPATEGLIKTWLDLSLMQEWRVKNSFNCLFLIFFSQSSAQNPDMSSHQLIKQLMHGGSVFSSPWKLLVLCIICCVPVFAQQFFILHTCCQSDEALFSIWLCFGCICELQRLELEGHRS